MKNQKYAVIGMGVSGQAAYNLLKTMGISSQQRTTFDTNSKLAAYFDPEKMLAEFQPTTLVVSPGVPLALPWIAQFPGEVTNELRLSLPVLEKETIVGVTGSQGKSTVVALLEAALEASGQPYFVGGNYGTPLATYVCDLLQEKRQRARYLALELSSYQLENCQGLRLNYSAITNFADNHLDRYPDREAYFDAKWNIARQTQDCVYLNKHDANLMQFAHEKVKQESLNAGVEEVRTSDSPCALLGSFNKQNLGLAESLVKAMQLPAKAIAAMQAFPGLPHRLEFLGEADGVRYINDSKATTIDSVLAAIANVLPTTKKRLFVLLGGKDKNLPWRNLHVLQTNEKVIPVAFGESVAKVQAVFSTPSSQAGTKQFLSYPTMMAALTATKKATAPGDTVLLSPGGSSLDEFSGFAERGDRFRDFFAKL